jgi:membrane-associated phospholipid phosphatase
MTSRPPRLRRALRVCPLVLVATCATAPALSDVGTPPSPAASAPTASTGAPATPPRTPALPPNEPPSVPTPGPEVRGGKPVQTDLLPPLSWDWAPFSAADWVIASTAGAVTLAAAIVHPLPTHYLQGGILFDDSIRNAVRPSSIQTRYAFRDASDVGLSLAATWPFFVDALATAWWYRGSRDTAQQMALLDLETLAISGAIQGVTNVLVSRQRPYGQYCGTPELPAAALDCSITPEYRSFFSGHSAFTFTAAALVCVNHTKSELLGSPWDALSCGASYVLAAGTASFRVLADVHYASDVLVGALVGTAVGYGVPLLHYRHPSFGRATTGGMTLELVPSAGGAGVVGTF